jgi:hypothetical protein
MDATEVKLANGAKIFIIENALDPEVLAHAHFLTETFSTQNPLWRKTDSSLEFLRWEYNTADPSFDPIWRGLNSAPALEFWQQKLAPGGPRLFCSNATFFVDMPGSSPLPPHVEASDSWVSQVYITDRSDNINGTTMYNEQKQVLFQLPYRNNTGWLFDNGSMVMHGREHRVPPDLERFSLMAWYAVH